MPQVKYRCTVVETRASLHVHCRPRVGKVRIWPASSVDLARRSSSVLTLDLARVLMSNEPKDERLLSCRVEISRPLTVDVDWLSYTRWRWLAPLHVTSLFTSPVILGKILVKFGKISIKQTCFTCLAHSKFVGGSSGHGPKKFAGPCCTINESINKFLGWPK